MGFRAHSTIFLPPRNRLRHHDGNQAAVSSNCWRRLPNSSRGASPTLERRMQRGQFSKLHVRSSTSWNSSTMSLHLRRRLGSISLASLNPQERTTTLVAAAAPGLPGGATNSTGWLCASRCRVSCSARIPVCLGVIAAWRCRWLISAPSTIARSSAPSCNFVHVPSLALEMCVTLSLHQNVLIHLHVHVLHSHRSTGWSVVWPNG